MSTRDDIIAKIQKLSRLTMAAGCTEAEAALAAERIATLMREHNISQTEASVRREAASCGFADHTEFGTRMGPYQMCATTIARVFDCRCYGTTSRLDIFDTVIIRYFGLPADTAACVALTGIIANAMTTESERFMARDGRGQGLAAKHSFCVGMATRLNERIATFRVVPTGSALLVLKTQLVAAEWDKLDLNLHKRKAASVTNSSACAAGKAAGSRVDIGGGKLSGASRMIGRS